ncbi:inorganic phosphate transporter [Kocuria flava]|uniref:inorganic phosphate transporter n=1 Tax=Kocuria flava TaxID=446860 RepID=UPI001FF261A1|nr:inorganic phosphate transporter [Kocuria flava]MCJ8503378.1 inorganic phosphate transporter [Kocuria flava]
MLILLTVLGLVLALAYTVVNGFHDAPNAVALPVRARALTPKVGVVLSALVNVAGVGAAAYLLSDWAIVGAPVPQDVVGSAAVVCALATTVAWNLLTWWWGLPSSSTTALFGGLIGALLGGHAVGLVATSPLTPTAFVQVLVPLVVAPALACGLAWLLAVPLLRMHRHADVNTTAFRSRLVLATGAAAVSFGHGIMHGRRAEWVFATLLVCAGLPSPIEGGTAPWLALLVAAGLATGTLFGGWRIAYTLSSRMITIDPFRGAVAQGVAGSLLFLGGTVIPVSLSTSQTTAAAVLGAGMQQRFRTVNARVLTRVLVVWALTVPVCGLVGAVLLLALSPLL